MHKAKVPAYTPAGGGRERRREGGRVRNLEEY
jgi:hypothetical protein